MSDLLPIHDETDSLEDLEGDQIYLRIRPWGEVYLCATRAGQLDDARGDDAVFTFTERQQVDGLIELLTNIRPYLPEPSDE